MKPKEQLQKLTFTAAGSMEQKTGGGFVMNLDTATGMVIPMWFPAATVRADGGRDLGSGWAILPTANTGAGLGSYTAAAGTHPRAWLNFNPGVSTTAHFTYLLPANWAPPLAMRIGWQSGDLAAAGSLFDLRVSTQCWKANTRYTASLAWGPEQSDGNGITGLNVDSDEDWQIAKVDNLRMDNCAAGDMLAIQFRRDPAGSLIKEARIYGVELLVAVKP